MTIKQMAQSALDVQSACNLSGVVYSFANIVKSMRESGMDTPTCNTHPRASVIITVWPLAEVTSYD